MIDLYTTARSRRDVVTMFFARDLEAWLAKRGYKDLTLSNQMEYLALPPSEDIRVATRKRLHLVKNRINYDRNIVPLQNGDPLPHRANQRVVLPTLPKGDARLTMVGKSGFGVEGQPDFIPNRGSLYYGVPEYFLGSDAAFANMQKVLRGAQHRFHVVNLAEDAPEQFIADADGDVIMFVSNVPSFLGRKYTPVYIDSLPVRWARPLLRDKQRHRVLHLLSASQRLPSRSLPRKSSPHMDVFVRMHAMINFVEEQESPLHGSMVEVIADNLLPRGMIEFPRTVIGHTQYLKLRKCEGTLTVLHILIGEGAIPKSQLRAYFDKAMKSSRYVLVMEHNGASLDFQERSHELFTHDEIMSSLGNPEVVAFDWCTGKRDLKRNMMFLVKGKLQPTFPNHYTCAFPY
jgi:hypothetical protein